MKKLFVLFLIISGVALCWSESTMTNSRNNTIGLRTYFVPTYMPQWNRLGGGFSIGPYYSRRISSDLKLSISGNVQIIDHFWGGVGEMSVQYIAFKLPVLSFGPEISYSIGANTFGFGDGEYLTQGLIASGKASLLKISRFDFSISLGIGVNAMTSLSAWNRGDTVFIYSCPLRFEIGYQF